MRVLEISAWQLQEVLDHALAEAPRECCGVLLGCLDGERVVVDEVLAAANRAVDPRHGYEIEPTALVAAQRRARRHGRRVVGYYHSHPGGPTTPSERDRIAAWSETSYLIVSTSDSDTDRPRSWRLGRASELQEEQLEVRSAG